MNGLCHWCRQRPATESVRTGNAWVGPYWTKVYSELCYPCAYDHAREWEMSQGDE